MKRRLAFSMLIFLGLTACEKDHKHFIIEGQKALQAQKFDEALKSLDKALELDKDNYQALWNKSLVYRRQGDFAKEAFLLEKILSIPAHSGRKIVVKPALDESYRKQADALTGKDNAAAEALLRKAIDMDKKSDANMTLAEMLSSRGESAMREAKFKEASDLFMAAKELLIPRKLKEELKSKIEVMDFMSFKTDAFMSRFKKIEKQLIEAGQFDEETKLFTLTTVVEVGGRKKNEEAEQKGEQLVLAQLTQDLVDFTWRLADKPRPEGAYFQYATSQVKILEKGFTEDKRPIKYQIKISLKMDDVVRQVRKVDEGKFSIKKPDSNEEAPADEGKKGKKGKKSK